MERQRPFTNGQRQANSNPHPSARLDQRRGEVNAMLLAADQLLDSLNNLNAQQYLEQNLQTGGQ